MTKKQFERAAEMAKAILEGHWTNEPPVWCHDSSHYRLHTCASTGYTRAVQTAEAFLGLFQEFNPRFDQQRFLVACGLVNAPVKIKAVRRVHRMGNGLGYRCDNNPNGPTEDRLVSR